MSEKFNDFWLRWYRENFIEQLEKLKTVETHEERKRQNRRISDARRELMEKDAEFRRFIVDRKAKAKRSIESARAESEAIRQKKEREYPFNSVETHNPHQKIIRGCP